MKSPVPARQTAAPAQPAAPGPRLRVASARVSPAAACILALPVILFAGRAQATVQTAQTGPSGQTARAQAGDSAGNGPQSAVFQQAESLAQQGHFDQAKAAMLSELAQHPSVEGFNLLGILEGGAQDYADALTAFQKALQMDPNSTRTHNNLGNLYGAQKKFDLAEKEFRTVLRLDPANRDGNYNLGVLLLATGSPAEAIPHLERVRPANLESRLNLIRANFESHRPQEALRLASELSASNAGDVRAHFSLGLLLAAEKQYPAAELELQKADALQPGTFEIPYNLGQAYLRGGDYSKAELALNQALRLKPDSAETLFWLAEVYANQSRPLDALDLLVRARKIEPENADIILLMARISMSQDYFDDAIPLLESGLKTAPQRTDLRAALGECYFRSGRMNQAIDEFKQVLAADASARSYAFLGMSYQHLGQFDDAKREYLKGLSLDPHNSLCLFNLGVIAERQQDDAAAEARFQEVLRTDPNSADALMELATLRIAEKKYAEAANLLHRFVQVSPDPAAGYYKLAALERSLHQTAAADRDLSEFQKLSQGAPTQSHPYEHLYDYLDSRSKLAPGARDQMDAAKLAEQVKLHPDQPEDLYPLAEAYLKAGKSEEAIATIQQLDKVKAGDYRTLAGNGVLLARYRLYDAAIQQFQAALQANPASDEVKFDLANAYFRKGLYSQALDTENSVSAQGRGDEDYLALLGDTYAHLGDAAQATKVLREAIDRNPDNDANYLTLALLQFRAGDLAGAKRTLLEGEARSPASGEIVWGLGLASVLEGNTAEAGKELERAVALLPEWPGSYSILGIFYYQTGQIAKAKEVLDRFKNSNAGGLDIGRIEQTLDQAPQAPQAPQAANAPLPMAARQQLLQMALALADRTL